VCAALALGAAEVYGPGLNSKVTWTCPGMSADSCNAYEQIGYPDSIMNTGVTDAIVTHNLVALPFMYNQPSHLTMTDARTIIVIYRSSGPRRSGDVGEGNSRFIYCSRKPEDSTWSEPIQIHGDSILSEGPNIYHIPGTDTTMAWYQTEAVKDVNSGWQGDFLASPLNGVRISTDDGRTWSEEIILPEIDQNEITDTAYNWFSHNEHHWNYTHRNPFVQLPGGELAGFAGTAGNYAGEVGKHCRSCYIRVPVDNLLHRNPDGSAWFASPIGSMDQWGCSSEGRAAEDWEHAVGHCGSLLIFNPDATELGFIGRYNGMAFSYDAGETWEAVGEANNGNMPGLQGGATSLDWWDAQSPLNGWHVRAGAVGGSRGAPCLGGGWGIAATDANQDAMTESGSWTNKVVSMNHHYGTGWYDCDWGSGFEDR
jgi:hypothetical protein